MMNVLNSAFGHVDDMAAYAWHVEGEGSVYERDGSTGSVGYMDHGACEMMDNSPTDCMEQRFQEWGSPVSSGFSDQENFPHLQHIGGSQHLTTKIRKERHGNRKLHQRSAANQRERRRMRTINDAFEHLRARIPMTDEAAAMTGADRKLSKVDTLKFAMKYIQQLTEVITTCDNPTRQKRPPKNTKVILRPKVTSNYSDCMHDAPPSPHPALPEDIYGHSLSWEVSSPPPTRTRDPHRLSTTLWVPEVATETDLSQQCEERGSVMQQTKDKSTTQSTSAISKKSVELTRENEQGLKKSDIMEL